MTSGPSSTRTQRRSCRPAALPGVVILLLLAVACARATRADEPAGDTLASEADLGRPAAEAVVRREVSRVRAAGAEARVALARRLGRAGGAAAAEALGALAAERDPDVRQAVFAAAVEVGLREPSLLAAARAAAHEETEATSVAALAVLGGLGDGDDVLLLLERAAAGPDRVRRAAFLALRTRLGTSAPFDAVIWRARWRAVKERATVLVPLAIEAIERDPADAATSVHVELLHHLGWVDLPRVTAALVRWFLAPEDRLRALACELSADLGLLQFARSIEDVRRFAATEAVRAAATEALTRLGVR